MNYRTFLREAFTGPGAMTRVVGATVLVATVAAQHPHPAFEGARHKDTFSVLPNWKFFAPNPATHDFHYLYRTLDHSGTTSPWAELEVSSQRKLRDAFWFPKRRLEKGVFDICSMILSGLGRGEDPSGTPAFELLTNFVKKVVRDRPDVNDIKGFQIALVSAAGHDDTEEPEVLFVSTYQPLNPRTPARTSA